MVRSISGYVLSVSAGMNRNTVTRLMPTPLASASPRSGPSLKRMSASARKPITVVRPLEAMEPVDMHSAFIIASRTSPVSRRHSSKRCSRNTE